MFNNDRRAHLMLRRGLVLSKADQIISETVAFCVDRGIEEIIWKADAEAFNHGITPLSIVDRYVPVLHEARQRAQQAGLIHSINPWITLKWVDFGRDTRGEHPDFDWRVGVQGDQAVDGACLRSEGWRRYLCEAYRRYASTRPAVLWLEDDYKTFVAGGGCFCDKCLAAFSQQVGQTFDRDKLLARIMAPGKPDPLRVTWIDFLGAEMVETCRQLEKAVHAECPHTRLGIMGSWSSDGRWWHEASLALAGPLQPISRPSLAQYVEGRATDFMLDGFDIAKEMLCFGDETQHCPELENSTYTPYAKSMRMTRLQMGLSQLLGNHSITMNLFDMVGTPIANDPRVGKVLAKVKPMLNALASACGPGGEPRGVRIVWDKRMADHIPLRPDEGAGGFQTDGEGWAGPLQGSGIPVIWRDAPVAAVTGRILHTLSDGAITQLLAGGLLLDGSAAATLVERGFEKHLGVRLGPSRERYAQTLSAEAFVDEQFAGGERVYVDFRRYNDRNQFYELAPAEGARIISRYVDPDEQPVFVGTTLFENELGGRIAVHAFDLAQPPTASYMNWTRKRFLASIIRWLGGDRIDLFVEGGAWMVPMRRDYARYVLVGILNFETDDWDEVTVTLAWDGESLPSQIQIVRDENGWQSVEPDELALVDGHLKATFRSPVAALDFLAIAFAKS